MPVRIRGYWYYGRTVRGEAVRPQLPPPRRSTRTTWIPPASTPAARPEDEQVAARRQRARRGPRLLLARRELGQPGRPAARLQHRHRRRRALPAPGQGPPDRRAAARPGARHVVRRHLGPGRRRTSSTRPSTRPGVPTRSGGTALGTDPAEDVVVHHEPDERFWVSVGRTRSDALPASSAAAARSPPSTASSTPPTPPASSASSRRVGRAWSTASSTPSSPARTVLLVLHNDGAENFELSRSRRSTPPAHEQWGPLLPHDPAVRLEDVDAFADHLVVSQRSEGLTQLRVLRLGDGGGARRRLAAGRWSTRSTPSGLGGNPEFAQPTLRFGYTTMATPSAVLQVDLAHRRADPAQADARCSAASTPTAYEQHREWADADDGTQVPISIVVPEGHRRATAARRSCSTATAPTSPRWTRTSRSPGCRCSTAAWASPSRTCAAAARWAAAGTRRARCCTSATPSPTSSPAPGTSPRPGWTSADRLVAEGGSAGGLLMGAVANLAPDAFAGILADVPFVDALTSILDPDLPLTVIEWEEWGNPLRRPRGLRLHEVLHAVRERRGEALPADPGRDLAQRHPGALRRAGQVGRPAAGAPATTPTTCCSRPRWRPATAASPAATTPGGTGRSAMPGCSTRSVWPDAAPPDLGPSCRSGRVCRGALTPLEVEANQTESSLRSRCRRQLSGTLRAYVLSDRAHRQEREFHRRVTTLGLVGTSFG